MLNSLSPLQARVVDVLTTTAGIVTYDALYAAMYPDGNRPSDPQPSLIVAISNAKRKLRDAGYIIETRCVYRRGYVCTVFRRSTE